MSSSKSAGSARLATWKKRPPYGMTLRTMVRCTTRRGSEKESAAHRCIGRNSANLRGLLRKMPTETGSTCTGPSVATCAMTASNTGRSWAGPVSKYSSSDIAGEQSCDCRVLPNCRPHFGQIHGSTSTSLPRIILRAYGHRCGARRSTVDPTSRRSVAEGNGGGGADVERVDLRRDRDAHPNVGSSDGVAGQAESLRAEQPGDAVCPHGLDVDGGARRGERRDREPQCPQVIERVGPLIESGEPHVKHMT